MIYEAIEHEVNEGNDGELVMRSMVHVVASHQTRAPNHSAAANISNSPL